MKKIENGFIAPWRYPSNWIYNIKTFFIRIKTFFIRGKYGITPTYDVWDLNDYMLQVMKNGLESFQAGKCSHPCNINEEEWTNIINRMIELIDIILVDSVNSPKANELWDAGCRDKTWFAAVQSYEEFKQDSLNELMDLYKEWWFDLWW